MNGPLLICYFISGLIGFFVMFGGVHKIYEGHIGVYTRGGALLPVYTEPGIHFMVPIVTNYYGVQVTVQTDKVTNIPCGTSSGVMIYFDKVEVVNRLKKSLAYQTVKNYTINYDKTWIFDKIHHEINQFCSSHTLHEVYVSQFDLLDEIIRDALQRGCDLWAPGIEIIAVRVTKPGIPYNIQESYEKMEREKTKLLITKEVQKVKAKEAETAKMLEKIQAETSSVVSDVNMQENILRKEGRQKIEEIENDVNFLNQKTSAEAENYKRIKEIEINNKRITKEYMFYSAAEALKKTPKNYFGKSIPEYFKTNIDLISNISPANINSSHSSTSARSEDNDSKRTQHQEETKHGDRETVKTLREDSKF